MTCDVECYEPQLLVADCRAGVRVTLVGLTHGEGATLQEASDALVRRLLSWAIAVRSSGVQSPRSLGPVDLGALSFLCELGDLAAGGEDIRRRLFG